MKLLHYGLQRSGTNFLKALLKRKFRVRFLNRNERSSPEHKHFRLYDNKDAIPAPEYRNAFKVEDFAAFERLLKTPPDYYVVISKDPYSWFLSYVNLSRKCRWPVVSHHYIVEYNLFYGKWLAFSRQTDRIVFVKYIDMLRDTDTELHRLENAMCLRRRLLAQLRSNSVGKVAQSARFTDERRSYYLREQYLSEYCLQELQAINDHIDLEVISLLGYAERETM